MHKLNLETDYKVNGNSTGCALDTLAIAVDGRDSNDIDWGEFNYREATNYVLEHYDFESDFLREASKQALKAYLTDSAKQAQELASYIEERKEAIYDGDDTDSKLYKDIEAARDAQAEQNYKEWVYGDHRDWAGILYKAQSRYNVEFTESKGDVFAEIHENTIAEWVEYERLPKKHTKKQALAILEEQINTDAANEYQRKLDRLTKARAERERVNAYKAEQAKEAEMERQKKIKDLIKKAK